MNSTWPEGFWIVRSSLVNLFRWTAIWLMFPQDKEGDIKCGQWSPLRLWLSLRVKPIQLTGLKSCTYMWAIHTLVNIFDFDFLNPVIELRCVKRYNPLQFCLPPLQEPITHERLTPCCEGWIKLQRVGYTLLHNTHSYNTHSHTHSQLTSFHQDRRSHVFHLWWLVLCCI